MQFVRNFPIPVISELASQVYLAGQRRVTWFNRWPRWQKIRRGAQAPFYRLSDTGFFGLTPLQTHILICGFPGSGTTLLQLMVENALPDARRFGKERSGWRAATYSWRNHSVLISKQPADMLRLDPLREFYRRRNASLRVIMMLRDPRDLLTSLRETDYCGSADDWRHNYRGFIRQSGLPDTMVVRFEDLIADAATQQQRISDFTGCKMNVPFTDFLSVPRNDFDSSTLCGLRPLDRSRIERWRNPSHTSRMQQVLQQLPELPDALTQLGYESDSSWTHAYSEPPSSTLQHC